MLRSKRELGSLSLTQPESLNGGSIGVWPSWGGRDALARFDLKLLAVIARVRVFLKEPSVSRSAERSDLLLLLD